MLSQEIVLSMATRETADVSDKPKSTSNLAVPDLSERHAKHHSGYT